MIFCLDKSGSMVGRSRKRKYIDVKVFGFSEFLLKSNLHFSGISSRLHRVVRYEKPCREGL